MKKPRKTYTDRTMWTPAQIAVVERYMDDADRRRIFARWDLYEEEIGHPVSSIRSMATFIRNKRREGEARKLRQNLRALADAFAPTPEETVNHGRVEVKKPAIVEIDSHRISTTTARLKLDAEMRDRIGVQGLTAGWFGDPPPGRSALDRKREATGAR